MRACNGCRKRKIKCDAATTNTWPCSACTRLKLVCVPPTIGQDSDFSVEQSVDTNPTESIGASNTSQTFSSFSLAQSYRNNGEAAVGSMPLYSDGMRMFPPPTHSATHHPGMYEVGSPTITIPHHSYHQQQGFPTSQVQSLEAIESSVYGNYEQSTTEDLTEVLGELKIDETGIAPYIRQQRKEKGEPEIPVQDEAEETLPPLSAGAGTRIRIPPELMPSDKEILDYFKIFFNDIHPYVPVVHRSHLYYQWQYSRNTISPLLLEALFACAGRQSDDPVQGAQWLALANKHESSFMDIPRLSTIQALLLLLKARESVPKKGYYYRSWQTVKTIVSMAKDLEIDEHYNTHAESRLCDLSPIECLVQTRVWQALLVVEVMIGAPQGRSDYGVNPNTVCMNPTLDIKGLDLFEIDRSRQYAYFVQNAHHIRIITDIYHKIKRQKDWGANPKLVEKNPLFTDWLQSLPPDLQINYPPDGSPPWIPSHFTANMHSHCHLGIILLHRPQLLASKSFAAGGGWKMHMALCYSSAKYLCRLQEGVLQRFGLPGLLSMQRGLNFAIYCIMTCTMLHLVAITSPDPNFHTDARDYFARHMRILERCSSAWPMPEMQAQIDSLRLAFSADVNRPFELKHTFPYGSPSEPYHPSPPSLDSEYQPHASQASGDVQTQVGYKHYPTSPRISASADDSKSDPSRLHSMKMIPPQPVSNQPMNAPLVDENSWNPTRIINQWDMAFSMAPSTMNTNSPPITMNNSMQGVQTPLPGQYWVQYGQAVNVTPVTPPQGILQQQFNAQQVIFTARDWQQSVASVYDPNGLKRRWNYSVDMGTEHTQKRPR
ncbi:hypothetical protein BDV28DRAFT_93210 [Aspergillus coremiiformis]|uniref:Zn(2)-C6 fungal-type domain-containing protein n=1 Tax=Aspergillus coremiiformis TaxID=138285 RepID=A0A5N6YXJ1_9EURO|nr:hypothetical protein BDV28DRAFT_93210 [Aspergillus coremiiformis]